LGKLPHTKEIQRLLRLVIDKQSASADPVTFDFEQALVEANCEPELAGAMADMIPEAFGAVVLREMNVQIVDRADFRWPDGSIRPAPLSSDPVWKVIGRVAESMASDPTLRPAFSRVAQGSACIDGMSRALNAGQSPAVCAVAFVRPPRKWSLLDRIL